MFDPGTSWRLSVLLTFVRFGQHRLSRARSDRRSPPPFPPPEACRPGTEHEDLAVESGLPAKAALPANTIRPSDPDGTTSASQLRATSPSPVSIDTTAGPGAGLTDASRTRPCHRLLAGSSISAIVSISPILTRYVAIPKNYPDDWWADTRATCPPPWRSPEHHILCPKAEKSHRNNRIVIFDSRFRRGPPNLAGLAQAVMTRSGRIGRWRWRCPVAW